MISVSHWVLRGALAKEEDGVVPARRGKLGYPTPCRSSDSSLPKSRIYGERRLLSSRVFLTWYTSSSAKHKIVMDKNGTYGSDCRMRCDICHSCLGFLEESLAALWTCMSVRPGSSQVQLQFPLLGSIRIGRLWTPIGQEFVINPLIFKLVRTEKIIPQLTQRLWRKIRK